MYCINSIEPRLQLPSINAQNRSLPHLEHCQLVHGILLLPSPLVSTAADPETQYKLHKYPSTIFVTTSVDGGKAANVGKSGKKTSRSPQAVTPCFIHYVESPFPITTTLTYSCDHFLERTKSVKWAHVMSRPIVNTKAKDTAIRNSDRIRHVAVRDTISVGIWIFELGVRPGSK